MNKKRIWTNDKYKNKQFFGYYTVVKNKKFSDRVFNLKEMGAKSSKIYSFESWQMAIKNGWSKQ